MQQFIHFNADVCQPLHRSWIKVGFAASLIASIASNFGKSGGLISTGFYNTWFQQKIIINKLKGFYNE